MPASVPRLSRELLLRSLVYLPILLLLIFQFLEEKRSAEKRIGISFESVEGAVQISMIQPGGPADTAGLRQEDIVSVIAGRPIESLLDYYLTASAFEKGQSVTYEVRRGEALLSFTVVPGTETDWAPLLLNIVLVLALLSMSLLTIARRPGSLPANLLFWLFLLVAFEMALPFGAIGAPLLAVLTNTGSFLLSGVQFGTMLHLACVIPQRQPWLRHRPWVVPSLYVAGLGYWTLAAVNYVIETVVGRELIPFQLSSFLQSFQGPAMLVWATLLIGFLSIPTMRHPTRQGRRQAGLVLLGALPWALFTYVTEFLSFMAVDGPAWLNSGWLLRVCLLSLPLAIFVVLQMQSVIQNTLLMRLTAQLQDIGSIEKISELISRDLNLAFHTKCNYVFFREDTGSDLTSVHSSGARVGVDNIPESYEILKIVDRKGEARTFPADFEGELPANEMRWLQRLRAKLIVPVMSSEHRLIGLLILGEKASEEPYLAHDVQIVKSLAGQIALAYENIGLHVQVHEQDRVQREMLERFEEQEIFLVKECPTCGHCDDSSVEMCPEDGTKLALTLPVERTIDDRYRLDRVLGKGGVAVVYQALDLRLDRTVAVKVLARSVTDAPDASRRFTREAQIVARLAHPRIVTLHDFGQTRQGSAYLVMEYLEGQTMGQILRREGPYQPERAAELFDQVLDGLAAAHRMGIVHRDLKPDNVLMTVVGDGGRETDSVKLLDFGLAKFHSHSGVDNIHLTMPGFVIGTLAYMAPEQLNGDEADERSDLFAVGVIAYEALVGRKPFKGRTPRQVLASMRRTKVEVPGESPAAQRLGAVLERCLAEDPETRYPSVEELREDLIPAIRSCPPLMS